MIDARQMPTTPHQKQLDRNLYLVHSALQQVATEDIVRIYAKYRGNVIGDSRLSKKSIEHIKDDLFKTAQLCGRKLIVTFTMRDGSRWVLRGNGVMYQSSKRKKGDS